MATSTSFKQQCPSCEAMVPIRDPGLIGRKIDCPKCKYRFVVEEPADVEEEDDAPVEKSDKVTTKPDAKGAVKGGAKDAKANGKAASKAGPRKKKEEGPKVKKAGASPVLIYGGGGLALVAVVGIIVGAVMMMSGGDSGKKQTNNPPPKEKPEDKDKDDKDGAKPDDPVTGPVVLANVSNLLPNDTQVVISYPMAYTMGSSLKGATVDEPGGYKAERFKEVMGVGLEDLNRILVAMNVKDHWVFSIVQTKTPFQQATVKKQLQLSPVADVSGKSGKKYPVFQVDAELEGLGNLLLKLNTSRERLHVHFLDANTLIFADMAPLKKFLEIDGKPEVLTKDAPPDPLVPPIEPNPAQGGQQQGGQQKGGPQQGGPQQGGLQKGGPQQGGAQQKGGPQQGGAQQKGGPQQGGTGQPGVPPPPAEAGPKNYMTIHPDLKILIERVEKLEENKETKKKEAASVLSFAFLVPAIQAPFLDWYGNVLEEAGLGQTERTSQLFVVEFALKAMKVAGGSLVVFNGQSLHLAAAVDWQTRAIAEAEEKLVRGFLPDVKQFLSQMLGVTVKIVPPLTAKPGVPAGGKKPPDEKTDGTIELVIKDRTTIGTLKTQLTGSDEYRNFLEELREAMVLLKSYSDLSTTRPHYHRLAKSLNDYVADKGEFPRGTAARGNNPETGLPYPADERLSFFAALLPKMGPEFAEWKVDPSQSWKHPKNVRYAIRILPLVLAHRQPNLNPPRIFYPGLPVVFGATHFVGVAGLGLDAADFQANDAASAKKRGVFGYDRTTRLSDIKDGPENTIALLLVPGDHMTPWLAGGGSTIRGICENDDDGNPLKDFVCIDYPGKKDKESKWDGKKGTIAIMADGKVRFIPGDLPAATFRALCTIAGGEKIDKIDTLCPVIEVDGPRILKTDPGKGPKVDPEKPKDKPKEKPVAGDDLKAMQGTWIAKSGFGGGEPVPAEILKGLKIVVTGKEMKFFQDGKEELSEFTLDPKQSPPAIDAIDMVKDKSGKVTKVTALGIYELKGNTLRLCTATPGRPRPKKFESTKEAGTTLLVLEREK